MNSLESYGHMPLSDASIQAPDSFTLATVTYLMRNNPETNEEEICLATMQRGALQGIDNGFGGKGHHGESVFETAARETKEESGIEINPDATHLIAVTDSTVYVRNNQEPDMKMRVVYSTAREYDGELANKPDEMAEPRWHELSELNRANMLPDTNIWLLKALGGQLVAARVSMDLTEMKAGKSTVDIAYINPMTVVDGFTSAAK